jgi:hypothetical protein
MKRSLFTLAILVASNTALADDCSSYTKVRGVDTEAVDGYDMPKIISTERAVPFSDDIAHVDDAYDEARLAAKAEISKLMSELVSSSETRNRVTDRIAETKGVQRDTASRTVEHIVKAYSSSSQAMLRGVVVLGDCYTPGKEVRVTVGLKPETLAQAAGLAQATSDSLKESPTPTAMHSSSNGSSSSEASGGNAGQLSSGKIRTTDGHSNTSKLDKF